MKSQNLFPLIVLTVFVLGCGGGVVSEPVSTKITVNLTVDFQGESDNLEINQSLTSNSTVMDLLSECKSAGILNFDHRGDGETAFVTSINGIKNQMGGGSNWVFHINGEMSDFGAGTAQLENGDSVLWIFSAEYLE